MRNDRYYINVKQIMEKKGIYPKPRRKRNFIVNYDEVLPIITISCDQFMRPRKQKTIIKWNDQMYNDEGKRYKFLFDQNENGEL